jgi:hypothetical protein
MAESSGFHTTAAVPAGHQVVSYTEALMDQAMTIISECHGSSGVAPDYLNKLAPSDGGANTLNVATGGAMVGGFWYYNSAVEGVTIPNAAAGTTRFDRVTLHHTGTPTFTVELTVNTGDAVNPPATPAGDVSIATVEVTDAGVLTVTDARDFADPVANSLSVSAPDSGTALSVKIAGDTEDRFNISTSGTFLWGTGAAAADVNLYRSAANVLSTADSLHVAGGLTVVGALTFAAGAIELADMAANSVDSDQYVDGSIDAIHIANRTRTIYVPASPEDHTITHDGRGFAMADAVDTEIFGTFHVPADYVSDMTVEAVVYPFASANIYCSHEVYYGAVGESYSTHSAASAVSAVAVTNAIYNEIKSLALANASIGDYAVVVFTRVATDPLDTINDTVYIRGFIVSYTADS